MGNFTTFADLRGDVLDRSGELNDGTSDFLSLVGRSLVRAAFEIYNAHPFLFLRKATPGVFRTLAAITAGTVNVAAGSTGITFSAPPAASVAGRKILVTGWSEVYRIATHTGGLGPATLDSEFNGASNPAASFTVFQDEYDLATDLRHVIWMSPSDAWQPIGQRPEEWILSEFGVPPAGAWPPSYFARIGESRIRLSQYPTQTRRMEYSYTTVGDEIDTGTILVPLNWRFVIADAGLFWTLSSKADKRAPTAATLFAGGLEKMVEDDNRKRGGTIGRSPASAGGYR